MSMELDHSFTVPVPPEQAWDVLLDVEKVAPCMPGAQVDTVDGDDVAGRLKVKVGPVSLTYKGTATFKDRDEADRSVLVEASGKEMRGSGTASATVRAALRPENGSEPASATLVTLHTTLNVTGRPAQFGRGVITEVGSRLIDRFADNLAQQLASGGVAAGSGFQQRVRPSRLRRRVRPGGLQQCLTSAASAAPPAAAEVAGAGETAQAGEMGGTEGRGCAVAPRRTARPTSPSSPRRSPCSRCRCSTRTRSPWIC